MGISVSEPEFKDLPRTPIMVLMEHLVEAGFCDPYQDPSENPPLLNFIAQHLDLEADHLRMAFDAGTEAASRHAEEEGVPRDGEDYFDRVYT